MTSKYWKKDYSHLDKKIDFPRVDRARALDAKIDGRWVNIYNFILTKHTTDGRQGLALAEWPEFTEVCAQFPNASKFRITMAQSILPWHFMK